MRLWLSSGWQRREFDRNEKITRERPAAEGSPTSPLRKLGLGFLLEGGGVGRAVFVFRRFCFFAGFVGRNYPFKSAIFGHGAEEEVRVAGEDRQRGTEKITRGNRIGFLRLAFLNQINHLADVRVRGAQATDCRHILLDKAE